jgi:hypothetical protein
MPDLPSAFPPKYYSKKLWTKVDAKTPKFKI